MVDTLRGGLVINEILADPTPLSGGGFDTDGSGRAEPRDEYVELMNVGATPIDASGLELWDPDVGARFTIPDGTILQPGGRILIITDVQPGGSLPAGGADDFAFNADGAISVLANIGDNVVVYDPVDDAFIQATYDGVPQDDPPSDYPGFSPTASRSGTGEDFGTSVAGESLQRFPDGGDTFFATQPPTPLAQNLCFTTGTLILTDRGNVPIEQLSCGSLVWTEDQGLQPLRWIGRSPLTSRALAERPALRPIRVRANALGPGRPRRDMILSPQHRVLVRGPIAARMFQSTEVLAPIKHLTGVEGIDEAVDVDQIDYIHLMFDAHQVIMAESAMVESLYAGPNALMSIHPAGQEEIFALFPDLRPGPSARRPDAARPLVQGKKARELAYRHQKNRKPLCCEEFA